MLVLASWCVAHAAERRMRAFVLQYYNLATAHVQLLACTPLHVGVIMLDDTVAMTARKASYNS